MLGSFVRDVVHSKVVGTTLGEDIHAWELEHGHSERGQLRDTSHPHMSPQVDAMLIRTTPPLCSEHASVVVHLQQHS